MVASNSVCGCRVQSPIGFTLLELVVVVAILGLLSASAAVMVRSPLQRAEAKQLLARLRSFETTVRDRANSQAGLRMLVLDDCQRIAAINQAGRSVVTPIVLPDGMRLSLRKQARNGAINDERSVAYDQFGTSETFALGINSVKAGEQWLLVLGLTGQHYDFDRAGDVDAILIP